MKKKLLFAVWGRVDLGIIWVGLVTGFFVTQNYTTLTLKQPLKNKIKHRQREHVQVQSLDKMKLVLI